MLGKSLVLAGLTAALAAGQDPPALASVRKYALDYVLNLPDYTCTQVTARGYLRYGGPGTGSSSDTVEEELSFVGGRERYKVLKVNGAPAANTSHEQLGGAVSEGEFGSLLKHIFDPATGTAFRPAAAAKLQGRTMNVFNYRVPQFAGYSIHDGDRNRDLLLAYQGSVWADQETNAVMRLTMKVVNIPSGTRLAATEMTLEYKPTELLGRQYILPSHFELVWRRNAAAQAPQEQGTSRVDFKAYRRFTAESNIDFSK